MSEHTDNEMLKFGRMVFDMITDALAVRMSGSDSYGSKRVTMRGNHAVHVFVVAGDQLAATINEIIASKRAVSDVTMSEKKQ